MHRQNSDSPSVQKGLDCDPIMGLRTQWPIEIPYEFGAMTNGVLQNISKVAKTNDIAIR